MYRGCIAKNYYHSPKNIIIREYVNQRDLQPCKNTLILVTKAINLMHKIKGDWEKKSIKIEIKDRTKK